MKKVEKTNKSISDEFILCGVMVKLMDCGIVVSEFVL